MVPTIKGTPFWRIMSNTYLVDSPVIPQFLVITDITQAQFMQVTVSTPNSYIAGQKIYFSVPFDYGMFQANGLTGKILAVDNTNLIFTMDITSTQFNPFVTPSGGIQPATLSPQGSQNTLNYTTMPFHSLNGQVGN